ncbi:ATP-dependent Clp protease ATP-binding subunit ClpE [Gemmata sp. SH-PL17]|uniref:AAA family ATPase n=1 Tax=Gemmata sp. SH-PL17 TaxID=1630693 RepID=UPI00078BE575|nr:AAA family ATPase [Gemmata sp. SH-PL17]AMV24180.1 ATP-dependent Clp protease ATP-binding subunit ClpE [Gemmata sp. SH-PL17]
MPDKPQADLPVLFPPEVGPSEDLTWLARRASPDLDSPFAGDPMFDALFDQLARALHRRASPHAALVGERGVGKSSLIAEFARRAAWDRGFLQSKRVLVVDARHTPPDEARARLTAILGHAAPHPDLVVCLDGLHGLVLPAQRESNRPALLASLARARYHLLAPLTPREFDDLVPDDPEFAELFTAVAAPEPEPGTALRLLTHFARGLSERYQVPVESEAVRQAVALTANYVLNDQLPAKALKVLTAACEGADYERRHLGRPHPAVSGEDVVEVVAARTGIPADTLRGVADRTDYAAALGEVVFGQAHAVREVATELGLIKAGMTDATKPASVMLFLGQTGTGKTELAKALARFYSTSKRLKTYTLGNCVEAHSVATIIGVPPGYVGSDRGGRLVTELNADPYGVFLLDEADKAHPDVLQPFLNLFDEGWVTDQRGTKAHAQKSIFVLTTNVGQRMIADMHKEGKSLEEITTRMKEALGQIRHGKSDRPVFTPEFLARIKRVIVFRPLDGPAMTGIARKQAAELRRGWAEGRNRRLELPDALVEYVGSAARRLDERANGKEGGRIVRKLVAEWIEAPLQRAMAAAPDEYRRADAVVLEFTPPGEPPAGDQAYPVPDVTVRFEPVLTR